MTVAINVYTSHRWIDNYQTETSECTMCGFIYFWEHDVADIPWCSKNTINH